MPTNFKHKQLMNLTKKDILEKNLQFPISHHYSYILKNSKNKNIHCKTKDLDDIPDDAKHVGIGMARSHIFQI